jgi:5'-deoxynucleotidase YfbR-like HD superfamily hydrolase
MSIDQALHIARLALAFSRVERVTRHEDGMRPETDSDHTIMLILLAVEFAPPTLSRGRIAEFAAVHDLAEAYAGDVQTLTIDAAARAAKDEREEEARARIAADLGADSWIVRTLAAYEAQQEIEARWVKIMDKVTPKLTHLLNGCVAAKALTDEAGFVRSHREQLALLRGRHGWDEELTAALRLLDESMRASEVAWWDRVLG